MEETVGPVVSAAAIGVVQSSLSLLPAASSA